MVKQIEYKRFLESYSDLKSIDLLITDLNGVLRVMVSYLNGVW